MAERTPASLSVNNTATGPPDVDADKDDCGCLSGEGVLTLTFDRGVLLDEKKYHTVNPPVMAKEEATHPTGITVDGAHCSVRASFATIRLAGRPEAWRHDVGLVVRISEGGSIDGAHQVRAK